MVAFIKFEGVTLSDLQIRNQDSKQISAVHHIVELCKLLYASLQDFQLSSTDLGFMMIFRCFQNFS